MLSVRLMKTKTASSRVAKLRRSSIMLPRTLAKMPTTSRTRCMLSMKRPEANTMKTIRKTTYGSNSRRRSD
jgi:hypothetical protein